MGKKIVAILGLIICLIGGFILILDERDSDLIPHFLKGTGFWILIIGSSFSIIYSLVLKQKKEK